MLLTTRAVVLRTVKHTDGRVVLRAYTERLGLRSCLVRTGSRNASRPAALQPLARVEIVLPDLGETGLRTARDLRVDRPYVRAPHDPLRGVLLLFAQEVFNKTLHEEAPDEELFAFVQDTLEDIDAGGDPAHQPLRLLVGLMKHLGFFPEAPKEGASRFDLRDGVFFRGPSPHGFCMEPDPAALFAVLIERSEGDASSQEPLRSRSDVRRRLLDDLLTYYRLHVEGFGELRSPDVLRAVLE